MSVQSMAIKSKRTSKPARRSSRSSSAAKHLAQPIIKPTRNLPIQAKLTIGQPNDKYEQEADRVADQVMRMSDADVAQRVKTGTVQPMRIQRLSSESENEAAQRLPVEKEEEEQLQAKEMLGHTPAVAPNLEYRINSLKSGGQPLDSATRSFFEPRFGYDLSKVRVHSDPKAAHSARAMNAMAYTMGQEVVFDSGQYQTDSPEGRKLIAHELTHVVQQGFASQVIQHKPKNKPPTTNSKLVYDEIKKRNPDLAKLITSHSIDFQNPKKPPAIKGGLMKNGEEHIWRVNVGASQRGGSSQTAKGQDKRTKVRGGVQVTHFIDITWVLPLWTNPEFLKQTSSANRAFTLTAAEPLYHELLHARIMMERSPNWMNQHTQVYQDFTKLMQIANSPVVDKERQKLKLIIRQIAAGGGAQHKAIILAQDHYYEFLVHEKYDADTEGKAFGRHYPNALIAKNYSKVVVSSLGTQNRPLQGMLNRMLAAAVEKFFDKLDQAATNTSSKQTSSPPSTKQP